MEPFRAPINTLDRLSGMKAAELIGAASDLALILDVDGVIRDVSVNAESLAEGQCDVLIGQNWVDTVALDSREKARALLAGNSTDGPAQRQINQLVDGDESLLLMYSTVELNEFGDRVALGKDLSTLTRVQQRLVNVQQSMERDYSKLRQFETRYRLLFQTTSEAILIAQANTARVIEANPAACQLLGTRERRLVGSSLTRWFDDSARTPLTDALAALRVNGKPVTLKLVTDGQTIDVHLSVFKTDNHSHLLIRLANPDVASGAGIQSEQVDRLVALVESAPDALVVTDDKGTVLTANTEFLDLSQLASLDQAKGNLLSSWLGQGSIDYQIIMASLREHGSLRLYATQIRGEFGSITDVEVSAVLVKRAEIDCVGFAIRNISRRVAANDDFSVTGPRSVDQLTQLVGRVPLKELVRESTELIEQLCIQAALKLTENNRASAAEVLGLSRQSLYVKLRRYALEFDEDETEA